MEPTIKFSVIKNREEFFTVFQGLCNTAEAGFNKFHEDFPTPTEMDKNMYCKGASYLMSITFVVMGMRGDWPAFKNEEISPFFVDMDGVRYDQQYLYKMNDYFANRFNEVLAVLEKIDPESHKAYKTVWANY